MTQKHDSALFNKFELYLIYLARIVSAAFIFVPLSNNTLTKYFIVMCAATCALSVYGSYITMICKAKH